MKTLTYLFAATLLCFSSAMNAQKASLIIFSEDADRFHVLVNGVHQTTEAQSNVKLTGLQAESSYKVKVIFQDNTLPGLEKAVYLQPNSESTFNIKRNKKGILKMVAFGYRENVNDDGSTVPNQYVVNYGSAPEQNIQNGAVVNNNTTTTTTTTTTTNTVETNNVDMNVAVDEHSHDNVNTNISVNTNINETTDGANINTNVGDGNATLSMNVAVSETGIDVNINETGSGADPNTNVTLNTTVNAAAPDLNSNTTYTETTTVTSTTTVNGQVVDNNNNITTNNQATIAPANDGNCYAMPAKEFAALKASIEAKDFEDSKLTIAKQVVNKNCLAAMQIKELMDAFDHESTRLEFAKYAHKRCADPQNFHAVNDAFTFESSIEELDEYVSGQ